MEDSTSAVLAKALGWARRQGCPLALASTTGATAEKMLDLLGSEKIRLVVMTHEGFGAPKSWRFNPNVRKRIEEAGHIVVGDPTVFLIRVALWFSKILGIKSWSPRQAVLEKLLGSGGWVCFKIVKRALVRKLVCAGEGVVAVAGKVSGADTALAFRITQDRPPKVALLEIISAPER